MSLENIIGGAVANQIPSHSGWKAKQEKARAKRAEREEKLGASRPFFNALNALGRANSDVTTAEERLARLRADLAMSEQKLGHLQNWQLQHGRAHPQAMELTFAVAQAPAIIAKAEADLVAAQDRLAFAQQHHDEVIAQAAAEQQIDVEPVPEPKPEAPATTKPKGRRS